jgi:hypothetical protein
MTRQEAIRALVKAIDRHVRPHAFPLAVRVPRPGEPVAEKVRRRGRPAACARVREFSPDES